MNFAERYRASLVFKSRDVEEPVDMLWHRPVAAAATALVLELPITPNTITLLSLVVGWTASVVFYLTSFSHDIALSVGFPAAGFLLFISVILDCMDGQFARAKGGGTRMGRILDGAVDAFVVAPLYVMMVMDIGDRFGTMWMIFAGYAGISSWIRILIYDRIKSIYMANTMSIPPAADGGETLEELEAEMAEIEKTGNILNILLFGLYLHGQVKFSRAFAGKSEDAVKESNSDEEIAQFRQLHQGTMRLISNLGLGSHMIFIYSSIALLAEIPQATLLVQGLFGTVFTLGLIVVMVRSSSMKPITLPSSTT